MHQGMGGGQGRGNVMEHFTACEQCPCRVLGQPTSLGDTVWVSFCASGITES